MDARFGKHAIINIAFGNKGLNHLICFYIPLSLPHHIKKQLEQKKKEKKFCIKALI